MENEPGLKTTHSQKKSPSFFWDLIKFCLISLAIVLPIRLFIAQPFIVSGKSMYPTFDNGEYLIVDELTYHLESPKRGDVIIFHFPGNVKEYFIKRIIGLPHESVAIKDGKVWITNAENPTGFFLDESYIDQTLEDRDAKTLGDDEYFVMGDNRGASYDSRSWGTLAGNLIVGRAFIRVIPFNDAGFLPGKHDYSTSK